MKYLPLYKKWMKTGIIPANGLCSYFCNDDLFPIIESWSLYGYWGYDGSQIFNNEAKRLGLVEMDVRRSFTPLRQTIVLFLAAMNGEL